jgi:sugar lactone lactonase YvrE
MSTAAEDLTGEVALEANDFLGETPVWSVAEQALYWVNCEEPPLLRRWHPESGALKSWPMPERIGGFVLREKGGPVVTLASGVYDLDPDSGALSPRARSPFGPEVQLHESGCDHDGRLWIGGHDSRRSDDNPFPKGGGLCRLDGDHLTVVVPDITISNALGFSPDGNRIYFTDSLTRSILMAEIDRKTGDLSNIRDFIKLGDGEFIDGATVDAEGYYWGALVTKGELRRYAPDGSLDRIVPLPFSNPTKPVFGGRDLKTIYITSTQLPLPNYEGPNGAIYAIRPGVAGVAEPMFRG